MEKIDVEGEEVPLDMRQETIDCNICSRRHLSPDEQYNCELCESLYRRRDITRP